MGGVLKRFSVGNVSRLNFSVGFMCSNRPKKEKMAQKMLNLRSNGEKRS